MEESSQVKETDSKLHQNVMNLELDWDSFKQSNPRSLRRFSINSNNNVKNLQDKVLDESPRELMSSLQKGTWKVRTNHLAVEEIIRERREALESGELKGRRLFEETDEMGLAEDIWYDNCNIIINDDLPRSVSFNLNDGENDDSFTSKEIPVCFQSSSGKCSSSSSSSNFVSNVETQKEQIVSNVNTKIVNGGDGKRVKCKVLLSWLMSVVSSVVIGIFIITCVDRKGYGYGGDHGNEINLIPT